YARNFRWLLRLRPRPAHRKRDDDCKKPGPFSILDFGFPIAGGEGRKSHRKYFGHVFISLSPIQNLKSKIQNSANEFVRLVQHRLRNRQADLLGSLEINDKLKLCWLFYG